MTWNDLMDLCALEFERLRQVKVISLGFISQRVSSVESIAAEELQCSAEVDQIIFSYLHSGRWPQLAEREKFFLRHRVRFAYDFSKLNSLTYKSPRQMLPGKRIRPQKKHYLKWLLIDVWRTHGLTNFLEPIAMYSELGDWRGSKWKPSSFSA